MYVDVWDHKGPVLFAIQYLGLTLTPHSLTGIWVLEWSSVFLLLWAFYLAAGLVSGNRGLRFLASVLSLHPFYYFYQQGNCVEECALFFGSGFFAVLAVVFLVLGAQGRLALFWRLTWDLIPPTYQR